MSKVTVALGTFTAAPGELYSYVLEFEDSSLEDDVTWTATEKKLFVVDPGQREMRCDLDESLMAVGKYQMVIGDAGVSPELLLFMGKSSVTVEGILTVTRNSEVYFVGTIRDDSIIIDFGKRTLSFEARPKTELVNRLMVRKPDGTANNPFGYGPSYDPELIYLYITDIFKAVNPDVLVTFKHTWAFAGDTDLLTTIYDGRFEELRVNWDALYGAHDGVFWFGTTVGEVLKNLAKSLFCYTGMPDNNHAFFKQLYYYDESNIQTMGRIFRYKLVRKYHKVSYVRANDRNINYTDKPDSSYYTALEGDVLNVFAVNYLWYIMRTISGSLVGVSNIQVLDPVINPTPGGEVYPSEAIANSWYHYRGDGNYCWVGEFLVEGCGYDYMKNFEYDGKKFQILDMKNDASKNTTEIVALKIGVVEA